MRCKTCWDILEDESYSAFIHVNTYISHIFYPDALIWRWYSIKRCCSSQQLLVQALVRHSNSWELEMTPLCQLPEGRQRGGVWLCMWAMWLTGHEAGMVFNKWTHQSLPLSVILLGQWLQLLILLLCFKTVWCFGKYVCLLSGVELDEKIDPSAIINII